MATSHQSIKQLVLTFQVSLLTDSAYHDNLLMKSTGAVTALVRVLKSKDLILCSLMFLHYSTW